MYQDQYQRLRPTVGNQDNNRSPSFYFGFRAKQSDVIFILSTYSLVSFLPCIQRSPDSNYAKVRARRFSKYSCFGDPERSRQIAIGITFWLEYLLGWQNLLPRYLRNKILSRWFNHCFVLRIYRILSMLPLPAKRTVSPAWSRISILKRLLLSFCPRIYFVIVSQRECSMFSTNAFSFFAKYSFCRAISFHYFFIFLFTFRSIEPWVITVYCTLFRHCILF